MARRNLSGREDIPADALRQRRDMYVLAIALLLYNLAGGTLKSETRAGGFLAISLEHPWVLLAAAWVGFFYFWWRFWLVSKSRPIADFIVDANHQLGDTAIVRSIAAPHANETNSETAKQRRAELLSTTGPRPKAQLSSNVLSLNSLRSDSGFLGTYGSNNIEVPSESLRAFQWAKVLAVYRAIRCERTFTDYTLPHLFAVVTTLVGAARLVISYV